MILRLLAALLAGAVIGYDRSFHGRPAGFRTHALVCTASCLLMLVTVYEAHWVRAAADSVRLDPTRIAQGIMTGIGFLGCRRNRQGRSVGSGAYDGCIDLDNGCYRHPGRNRLLFSPRGIGDPYARGLIPIPLVRGPNAEPGLLPL
jgi:hypothetical protein